jgi:hypothetical protein
LEHIFDHNGLTLSDEKISVIKNYPRPTTLRRLKSFLAMSSYFRRYINDYSHITTPLRALLEQDAKFQWTDDCEEAFQYLKTALTTAPILALPNFNREFILTTDASNIAIYFILSQKDNEGRERVIEYAGRCLHENELNWTVSEKEALAVVEGVRHCRTYLSSRPFQIVTDHLTLTYFLKNALFRKQQTWSMGVGPSAVPVSDLLQERLPK